MNVLHNKGFERREWRWVLLWTVAALILANVPYLLGALLSRPEMRFGGAVYGVEDVNSYFAKMRQGANGAWLFHIPYTVEEHPGTIVYIHYLLLGKLAHLTGLSLELTYHVARLVCGALLLGAIYSFRARFTPHRAIRRIAFLLIVFSGGLGWLLTVLGRAEWLGSLPLDLISPEGYVFLTLYSPPHIALVTACLLWGLLYVRDGAGQHHIGKTCIGAGAFLIAALIGAFYLVVPYSVLGVAWLIDTLDRRHPDWRALWLTVLSGIPTALVLGYDAYYFGFDPVYSVWAAQNLVPSLHPLHYVAGYLLLGTLAILGAWRVARKRWRQFRLPLAWLLIVPLLLSLPFSARRRLVIGALVPLGLFAALGWVYCLALPFGRSRFVRWLSRHPRYSRAGMRRWVTAALVLITVPTNLLLILGNSVEISRRGEPIFHSQAELDALDWLRTHSTADDTVLCAYGTGNYVPARAGNRVLLGLDVETIHSDRKRAEVDRFFNSAESDAWRRQLLDRYRITYVLVGPNERALGAYDPDRSPDLVSVYRDDGYVIYQVEVQP